MGAKLAKPKLMLNTHGFSAVRLITKRMTHLQGCFRQKVIVRIVLKFTGCRFQNPDMLRAGFKYVNIFYPLRIRPFYIIFGYGFRSLCLIPFSSGVCAFGLTGCLYFDDYVRAPALEHRILIVDSL
jgi:hypothetical protein